MEDGPRNNDAASRPLQENRTMKPQQIRLFVKPGCPWCDDATDWLDQHRIQYQVLDVIRDPVARREMHQLTGQTRAPSIDVDGEILADFGADELEDWWKQQGFELS